MRKGFFIIAISLFLFLGNADAATFVSGSTGADGVFNPAVSTEVQLPPDGIFNFTTVNIPSGVTVTFKKNAANTPVYILAAGDVTIAGTISVNGGATSSSTGREPGKGGPGGYDGGYGGILGISGGYGGKGLGPGGGGGGMSYPYMCGGGGGFGTVGMTRSDWCASGGSSYGNSKLVPLIGGSGGGGGTTQNSSYISCGGGGGGGAILIASSGTIIVSDSLSAYGGGSNCNNGNDGGGGSGGAIRLISNTIKGGGSISASGGGTRADNTGGGAGRIRIEAYTNNFASATNPAYSFGLPSSVFVPNQPSMNITSIGGVAVPLNPTASYSSPDIALPGTTTNPVAVILSAANIPVGTTVTVSVIPQQGSASNFSATLAGTDASSTATADINLSIGSPYIIAAQTTFTLQTAMFYDGEKIEKVRVASTMGKGSEVTYITEKGKEIPEEKLMAKLLPLAN